MATQPSGRVQAETERFSYEITTITFLFTAIMLVAARFIDTPARWVMLGTAFAAVVVLIIETARGRIRFSNPDE